MKYILVLLMALCAFPAFAENEALSGNAQSKSVIVGTLADANNPVEMACAPEYTRIAVLRQRTAIALRAAPSSSGVDAAKRIQQEADASRTLLDAISSEKEVTPGVAETLSVARAAILRGETTYDHAFAGAKP